MKPLTLLLTTFFLLSLLGCSEEVPFDGLVEQDGLYYKKGSEEPFTGNVVGEERGKVAKGKREGEWTRWYENGQLWERRDYKNGKLHGLYQGYYDNGQLRWRVNYNNGKEDGLSETYTYGGGLREETYYKNGKVVNPFENRDEKLPIGWKVSEKIIPPQCFSTIWMSGDNYEEFAKKFDIKNYKDFFYNPGKFLGKEIPNLEPINAWDRQIYLAASLKDCFKGNLEDGYIAKTTNIDIKIINKSIRNKICSTKSSCIEYSYTILSNLPLKKCKNFAPHISGKCEASFLISVGNYSGGSMGWDTRYNIYGLFSFNDDKKFIIPLKNFDKESDAVNYLRSIN